MLGPLVFHELRGPSWSTKPPITRAHVLRKRQEFWETSPSYSGRPEIWDALRAACEADEDGLAYAILDSAGITLPDGCLHLAYDELGNSYQIPSYCLRFPSTLVDEQSQELSTQKVDLPPPSTPQHSVIGPMPTASPSPRGPGTCSLRARLSNGTDIKLLVEPSFSVGEIKQLIRDNGGPDTTAQRVFMFGRPVVDARTLDEIGWQKDDVLQVFLF